jgi:anti-sigma B factor antagonist
MLNDEIRHALLWRTSRLVIDLARIEKMDSAGLGTLLYARAELSKLGGGLALSNLDRTQMKALLVTRLETVFNVYATEQDAINSFFPDREVPHYDLLAAVTATRQDRARLV